MNSLFPEIGFGSSWILPFDVPIESGTILTKGPGGLKHQVKVLVPQSPGVYGLRDASGTIIYVGKAKNLRTRLLSYFSKKLSKEKRLIRKTTALSWECTFSEFIAYLRELEIINIYKPVENVAGKVRAYRPCYLVLTKGLAPKLCLSAKAGTNSQLKFGPFRVNRSIKKAITILNDFYMLRDCPSRIPMVFSSQFMLIEKTQGFACIRHEIGKCLGPCGAGCTRKEYAKQVSSLKSFLVENDQEIFDWFEKQRELAANRKEFELAAEYHEKIESLVFLKNTIERVSQGQNIHGVYEHKVSPELAFWIVIEKGVPSGAIRKINLPSKLNLKEKIVKKFPQLNSRQIPEWWVFSQIIVERWLRTRKSPPITPVMP